MPTSKSEILRRVIFRPYLKGRGPTFRLVLWDTNTRDEYGKWILGYCLSIQENGGNRVLFEGEDFHCSPMRAVDSDKAMEGIISFLTLRPGDTDPEYFESYTQEQLDYCSLHAEALACEVMSLFGKE